MQPIQFDGVGTQLLGSMSLTAFMLVLSTIWVRRSFRFRLVDFLVNIWL